MSNIDKKPKIPSAKKVEKGFSTVLLLNLSPFGDNFKELNEGIENTRLNTSACMGQGDNTLLMNDFLSNDLLKKIDAESPNVKNKDTPDEKGLDLIDIGVVNANDISKGMDSSYGDGESDEDKNSNHSNSNNNKENSEIIVNSENKKRNSKKNQQEFIMLNQQKNAILSELNNQSNYIQQNSLNNINNKNQARLFSYYDSTSKYLSQSLQDEKNNKNLTPNQNIGNYIDKYSGLDYYNQNQNLAEHYTFILNQNMNDNNFINFPMVNNNYYDIGQKYNPNFFNYQNMNMNNCNANIQNMKNLFEIPSPKNQNVQNINLSQNMQNANVKVNNSDKLIEKEEDYVIEMFGRMGWICDQCNNFNYDTRNKCNRCGIPKSPKKISKLKRKLENKKREQEKQLQKQQNKKEDEDKKGKIKERKGDWICAQCKNLNFSFRVICNRCQLPKNESEMMLLSNLNPQSNIYNTDNMNLNINQNFMNQQMKYNKDLNHQIPLQFINNGQIYCNNINLTNQNINKDMQLSKFQNESNNRVK